MTVLRVIIVDDEAPARSRMRRLLSAHPEIVCVGEAESGAKALGLVESLSPDVVFLDVQMPEMDGITAAAAIGDNGPAVVFVTAFDEYALRAFEVSATDYLVKPVSAERLAVAIGRLCKRAESARDATARLAATVPMRPAQMAIRSGSKYSVFEVASVTAVVARDSYAAFMVSGEEHLSDDTLERLEQRLDPAIFMRVHRSAIVNLSRIVELVHEGDRKYSAKLTDGTMVPISRSKLDELKVRFRV